ncbi:MAG: hypothetical protein LV479_09880 [Methylacidiphilales bacterium]|nr:hypothetical protein [Candidatus Methylacidiphilales bacterium]
MKKEQSRDDIKLATIGNSAKRLKPVLIRQVNKITREALTIRTVSIEELLRKRRVDYVHNNVWWSQSTVSHNISSKDLLSIQKDWTFPVGYIELFKSLVSMGKDCDSITARLKGMPESLCGYDDVHPSLKVSENRLEFFYTGFLPATNDDDDASHIKNWVPVNSF